MGPANPGTEAEERSNGYFCGHAPSTGRLTVLRHWRPGDPWIVRNVAGRLLSVMVAFSAPRLVLEVSALAGGIYLVDIYGAEGREMHRVAML